MADFIEPKKGDVARPGVDNLEPVVVRLVFDGANWIHETVDPELFPPITDEFIEMIDTPNSYAGFADFITVVDPTESFLEFKETIDFAFINIDGEFY